MKNFRFSIFDFRLRERLARLRDWLGVGAKWEQRAQRLEGRAEHWEQCYWTNQSRLDALRDRCEQWEKIAEEQRERANQAEKKYDGLSLEFLRARDDIADLEQRIELTEVSYFRRPAIVVVDNKTQRRNLERLLVLAGMDEQTPLWQVVLSYADEHERNERETALKPEPYPGRAMTDGERHYNAGRAASAYDFAMALRDLYREAQLEAKKRA